MIAQNPYITRTELANQIGISEQSVQRQFSNLKKKGLIERIGPDKGGYWKVKEEIE